MNDDNDRSPISNMVLRVRQTGPQGYEDSTKEPRLKMVSFRVPVDLLVSVDAFAVITAQSRNTTLIDLLSSGVHAVANALDDPEPYFVAREHVLALNAEE